MKSLPLLLAALGAAAPSASAETLAGIINNDLIFFDSATPGTIARQVGITGLGAGENIIGIDFRPRTGGMYGVGITNAGATDTVRLFLLDPNTGAAAAVTTAPFSVTAGSVYGVDFNPTVDRIRVVNSGNENSRINPNNGVRADTPTNDTDLNPSSQFIDGVAYDRNFDSGFAVANRTTLFGIARTGNRLVTIGGVNQSPSPNGGAVNTVGAGLGFTISPAAGIGFDISPRTNIGYAAWIDNASGQSGLYQINLGAGSATLVGAIGGGTVAVEGLSVAPAPLLVFGPDGKKNKARVFDVRTAQLAPKFPAFPEPQKGGVRVAVGDLNVDGTPDIIVASGRGSEPTVKAFDGRTGATLQDFLAYDAAFRGGVFVAAGDVNGDGFGDIITAPGSGMVAEIRVFKGQDHSQILAFPAFGTFDGGATVAASDLDLDGRVDIVAGSGPGLAPEVRVFNADGTVRTMFNPYGASQSAQGVIVAASHAELRTTPAPPVPLITPTIATALGKGSAQVKIFTSPPPPTLTFTKQSSVTAFPGVYPGGVRVALADVTGDAVPDLIAVPGPGTNSTRCRIFDGVTGKAIKSVVPFTGDGAFVAAGR